MRGLGLIEIIGFLKEADKGVPVKELCREHGYAWRSKFGCMDISDAKKLKALEVENARLNRLLAESLLESEVTKEALRKKMVTAPARRELVRWVQTGRLTERRSLAIAGMSASSLRYQPRPNQNHALREQIVSLAQRHRRYGAEMIYLKIRQSERGVVHRLCV